MGRDPSWWDSLSPPSESSSDESGGGNSVHKNERHTGPSQHTWASTPRSGTRSGVPRGGGGGAAATRVGLGGDWAAGMQLGRYRLCRLLDKTHFSFVWLAQPNGGPAGAAAGKAGPQLLQQQQRTQNLASHEEDSGYRCGGSGGEALGGRGRGVAEPPAAQAQAQGSRGNGSCCAGGPDRGGTQGLRSEPGAPSCDTVVIKALDASRPAAAAAAATELAALRRLRQLHHLHEQQHNKHRIGVHLQQQVVQQEQQQKHRQEQNQEQQQYNGRREGAQAANAGHATVQAAAGWPFVQLLDSFTWRGGGDGHGSGSGSGSGPMGASGGAECVGAGGGAARCLVLQQLGPCATDVLSMWREEQDGVQQEGQEGGRGSESCGGARGAVGREAAGGGWRGGLPPCAVKRFARQALWALDLLHRSARLAHCDIKPGNFCLSLDPPTHHHQHHVQHQQHHQQQQQQQQQQLQGAGHDPAEPGRRSAVVRGLLPGHSSALRGDMATWSWRVLDFGNACSLEAADGARPPGGRIRPCATVIQHGAPVLWYDTPSYAAPDVALGLPPSAASDMWSLACTVYELASGRQLFPVPQHLLYGSGDMYDGGSLTSNDIHLALVQQMLGPLPQRLLRGAPAAREHFDRSTGRLLLEEDFEALPPKPLAAKATEDLGGPRRTEGAAAGGIGGCGWGLGVEAGRAVKERGACREQGDDGMWWTEGERDGLVSFLTPLVRWDPRERWSARQAAEHPWLRCGR